MSKLPIAASYLDEDPSIGVDRNSRLEDVDVGVDLDHQGEAASSSSTSFADGNLEEALLGNQVVVGAYNQEVEA